jgi:hypothetical protein
LAAPASRPATSGRFVKSSLLFSCSSRTVHSI